MSRITMLRALVWIVLTQAGFNLSPTQAQNAATGGSSGQVLPANPSMWLNSPPLTAETLKGKGVVLWFYEEQCPNCRKKWPDMLAVAKKYEGEPVVFIAVNSGNPPDEVEQYARGVNLPWPVIVDPTRDFEKQWLDNEISLENIHQLRLILPSGQKAVANSNDFEGAVHKAAEGAAWNIDPKTIPVAFQPTWRLVEMGKYAAASAMLKKGLATKNEEVKEAATRVNDFVQKELKSATEQARELREQGDAWKAYRAYNELVVNYAGYDVPPEVAAATKELAADPKVKAQLSAAKTLESIKKSFPPKTDAGTKRIIRGLQQLVKEFPETDAAAEAKLFMDRAALK